MCGAPATARMDQWSRPCDPSTQPLTMAWYRTGQDGLLID
jgi:hypothetical protein